MAATRKVNNGNDAGAVMLDALDPFFHYLMYTVSVDGADPLFVLVDAGLSGISGDPPEFPVEDVSSTDDVLLVSDGAPHKTYKRRWPNDDELSALTPGAFRKHVLGMSFLKATKYRFKVERFDIDDELQEVLTDIEWSSSNPDTERFESFDINIPADIG